MVVTDAKWNVDIPFHAHSLPIKTIEISMESLKECDFIRVITNIIYMYTNTAWTINSRDWERRRNYARKKLKLELLEKRDKIS